MRLDEAGDEEIVGGDDLRRPQRLAGRAQFVAGGQDRDAGTAAHGRGRAVRRGRPARRRAGSMRRPAGQQRLALAKVDADVRDVVARLAAATSSDDELALASRVLLERDAVGAARASARR